MGEIFNQQSQTHQRQNLRNQMPKAEVILWSKIKGRQILDCKFRRQFGIGGFVVDFYSPEIKLAIELDGESHFDEGASERDRRRDEFIRQFDVRLIRFLNTEIYDNPEGVLAVIAGEIQALRGN